MRVKKYNESNFPLISIDGGMWRSAAGFIYVNYYGNEFVPIYAHKEYPYEKIILETKEETVRKILDKVL